MFWPRLPKLASVFEIASKIECAENSFLYECLNWFAFFHAFVIDDADGNVCKS